MDEITRAVRDLYEQFSYPSGPPVIRVGFDARLLLSFGRLERPAGRAIRVLDAGCGRGMGLLAAASLQPDVEFLGVDLNRVGLEEIERTARSRKIENVKTAAVDLMNLEGLEVPDGGFDVIHSSGVIHHLADPRAGLTHLARSLAPHGVLSLMVYSDRGREGIHPVARAIALLADEGASIGERLKLGRELVRQRAEHSDDEMWRKASEVDNVEFVDRYLHPCERSYDVASLWDLVEASGLTFLRWVFPHSWEVAADLEKGELRERAEALPPRERFRLMQEFRRGGRLQLYVCHPENGPRPSLGADEVDAAAFALHPEGVLETVTRGAWGNTRIEKISWRDSDDCAAVLPKGPLARSALILREQNLPFRGRALVEALAVEGYPAALSRRTILELLRRDILYRPHEVEVAVVAAALAEAERAESIVPFSRSPERTQEPTRA